MALEALCSRPRVLAGGWRLRAGVLDFSPLLDALIDRDPADGADLFHGTLAAGLAELALHGLGDARQLAIAGGCAVNRPLLETLRALLARQGSDLLIPRQAPPGDGRHTLAQAQMTRPTTRRAWRWEMACPVRWTSVSAGSFRQNKHT